LSEPQKAYPISEFTIMTENHGHLLLCLVSVLATVVCEAVKQKQISTFGNLLKLHSWLLKSIFLLFILYFALD